MKSGDEMNIQLSCGNIMQHCHLIERTNRPVEGTSLTSEGRYSSLRRATRRQVEQVCSQSSDGRHRVITHRAIVHREKEKEKSEGVGDKQNPKRHTPVPITQNGELSGQSQFGRETRQRHSPEPFRSSGNMELCVQSRIGGELRQRRTAGLIESPRSGELSRQSRSDKEPRQLHSRSGSIVIRNQPRSTGRDGQSRSHCHDDSRTYRGRSKPYYYRKWNAGYEDGNSSRRCRVSGLGRRGWHENKRQEKKT